jgi:hypothetical protein
VLHGVSKLENLIRDLKGWNDGLQYFQPREQRASLELALPAAVSDNDEAEPLWDVMDADSFEGSARETARSVFPFIIFSFLGNLDRIRENKPHCLGP